MGRSAFSLVLLAMVALIIASASAEVFFEENFDGAPPRVLPANPNSSRGFVPNSHLSTLAPSPDLCAPSPRLPSWGVPGSCEGAVCQGASCLGGAVVKSTPSMLA